MNLKYKISFHSLWHCGSGESKGADMDALVIKDSVGLPYIPGKTIKGLIKDGMHDLIEVDPKLIKKEDLWKLFGREAIDNDGITGVCFFTNAKIPEAIYKYLDEAGSAHQKHLFRKITSTSIDDQTGVARDRSLRSIEATVPMELEGEIMNVPEKLSLQLEQAMQMVKLAGVGRNRGLGRCTFEITEKQGGDQ